MKETPSETQEILRHWSQRAPNDRMAHLVRDTARAYTRTLQGRLEAHQIPFGHWAFLRILWQGDGLTQRELSARAGVMEPTTAVAIRAMESKGIVSRIKREDNKKNIYVFLTPHGRALEQVLIPLAIKTNLNSLVNISEQDLQTTRQVLLQILENLAQEDGL